MKKNTLLIFDFDGTIVQTIGSVIKAWNLVAMDLGFRKVKRKDVNRFRNKGVRELLKISGIPLPKLPFVAKKVKSILAEEIENLKPAQNLRATLLRLKKNGYGLGILTSNSKENVEKFLEKNKMNFFDFIYPETSVFGKDKVIKRLLKDKNLNREQVIYIGDEIRDIEAAKKARIKIIAVGWGYNTEKALSRQKPDYLIKRPGDLIEVTNKL